ncbi:MAG: hypothetical protein ACD_73C00781G0004 [uncultured bacterium]|nr:MAG: hypothetical protein ACD_73C00781G0004 [uncultured bacterium]
MAINPEAVEVCDDNINNDCDAATSDAGAPVEDPATDGTLNPLIKKVVDGGGLSCSTSPLPEDKGSGASGGGCGCDISQKPGAIHQVNMTLVILGLMLSLIPVGLRLSKKD